MGFYRGPNIVTDGLVLALDAAPPKSYPGTGTTWYDLSGNGNNGSLVNGVSYSNSNGGLLEFDGTDDYTEVSDSATIDITGPISMEIVFKTVSESVTERLIDKTTSGGTYGYGYNLARYSTDRMLATYNNGNTQIFLYSNYKASDFFSNFTHVIYAYDGADSQKMWINGIDESGQNSFTSNFVAGSTSGTDLDLMRRGGEYAEGDVAFFRFYNKALSAQEVYQNYNATKSRFGL